MGKFTDILEKSGVDQRENWREEPEEQPDKRRRSRRARSSVPQQQWDERFQRVNNISWQAAESFRMLRSKILYPDDGGDRFRTIMVTSSSPSEGKSFVSANIGVSIAQGVDQHALLVDCDLRRPSLAKLFGISISNNRGLADYLADEKYQLSNLLLKTAIDKLSILPSGMPPDNPAELLASARMSGLVDELSSRYEDRLIIFDSPPFQVASETVVLSKRVDGVVLVVGYGKSARAHIKEVVENIGADRIIGVVFNGMRDNFFQRRVLDAYGYYGSYYGYVDKKEL
ncbi:MAG: polysaccharide biosynthesis tyrosine autokinase [Desulfobulbaceae bacterium]|jgi:exopolysaccharide/PEP-CTERM locus tyrosine autokinase|nr:polysaccharide biosynthesis tyrosine autokinase [Desulfobulbaceae bacterium]